ncbi:hypothetical protein HII31_06644 [Pseudocercospora fuligena]|uniref:Uncharacterized protein n=1 Tax=Pseudocercospora fuligena TaxID=685502 RepID=A0A8H6VL34_9PEZI|nr:hypothetical protein HII31_06644 [Pseudocercospora fuligena]
MLVDLGMTDRIKQVFSQIVDTDKEYYSSFTNFLFPALTRICEYMRANGILPTLPEYQQFSRAVLERYISRKLGVEPSMARSRAGCGDCSSCSELDAFLSSTQQESTVLIATEARADHMRARLKALWLKIDCDVRVAPEPGVADPSRKKLILNKANQHFKGQHSFWKDRRQKLKSDILSLGSEAFVRTLLGNRYQEFIDLQSVTLARDASGQELGVGLYVKAARTKPAAASAEEPGVRSAEAVSINNKDAGIRSPSASSDSAKRKEGPMLDQENVQPKKRPAIEIIDLGSP